MKKSVKFMAVVLAVVLALSCFTAAFAFEWKMPTLPDKETIESSIGSLKEKLDPAKLIAKIKGIPAKAEANYYEIYDTENKTVIIPDYKMWNGLLYDANKVQNADGTWPEDRIKFDFNKLGVLFDNQILNSIQKISAPIWTGVLKGVGQIFGWNGTEPAT